MAVYSVMSENANPALRAAVEQAYPLSYFHWTDRISFVEGSGTAQTVSTMLGIQTRKPDGTLVGTITGAVVMQVTSSYWGWTGKNLWEWLVQAHQKDGG